MGALAPAQAPAAPSGEDTAVPEDADTTPAEDPGEAAAEVSSEESYESSSHLETAEAVQRKAAEECEAEVKEREELALAEQKKAKQDRQRAEARRQAEQRRAEEARRKEELARQRREAEEKRVAERAEREQALIAERVAQGVRDRVNEMIQEGNRSPLILQLIAALCFGGGLGCAAATEPCVTRIHWQHGQGTSRSSFGIPRQIGSGDSVPNGYVTGVSGSPERPPLLPLLEHRHRELGECDVENAQLVFRSSPAKRLDSVPPPVEELKGEPQEPKEESNSEARAGAGVEGQKGKRKKDAKKEKKEKKPKLSQARDGAPLGGSTRRAAAGTDLGAGEGTDLGAGGGGQEGGGESPDTRTDLGAGGGGQVKLRRQKKLARHNRNAGQWGGDLTQQPAMGERAQTTCRDEGVKPKARGLGQHFSMFHTEAAPLRWRASEHKLGIFDIALAELSVSVFQERQKRRAFPGPGDPETPVT
ncbi:unnamed protein product [Symbiodinium microadriaticum]|nr:unnamed protein product [Symbiodinium microadriaticum]